MSDHLNSMHLEPPRREKFRQAREVLLNSCGERTRMGGRRDEDDESEDSRTLIQNLENRLPEGFDYGLLDRDAIYPLRIGLNTIGRMPDNEVVIEDPYVSRRHCAIVIHAGDGFEIHDVASKNGTYLNGNRLSGPTPIKPGDEIRMCERNLVFITRPNLKAAAAYGATLPK